MIGYGSLVTKAGVLISISKQTNTVPSVSTGNTKKIDNVIRCELTKFGKSAYIHIALACHPDKRSPATLAHILELIPNITICDSGDDTVDLVADQIFRVATRIYQQKETTDETPTDEFATPAEHTSWDNWHARSDGMNWEDVPKPTRSSYTTSRVVSDEFYMLASRCCHCGVTVNFCRFNFGDECPACGSVMYDDTPTLAQQEHAEKQSSRSLLVGSKLFSSKGCRRLDDATVGDCVDDLVDYYDDQDDQYYL